MKKLGIVFSLLLSAFIVHQMPKDLCDGFLPENDLQIPVGMQLFGFGLDQAQFNAVIDRAEKVYKPVVAAQGATLKVNRLWDDGTVNAAAYQDGATWNVDMYGGLARHPAVTADGLSIVVCHEIGHHIGGAPKNAGWFNSWASNEGQSDYFATLKCLRKIYSDEENITWAKTTDVDPVAEKSCSENFSSEAEVAVCLRAAAAALSIGQLFKAIRNETIDPLLDTLDPAQVLETFDGHPATQCRVDTFFAGGLCTASEDSALDDMSPAAGTCFGNEFKSGLRPRCWFAPPTSARLAGF